MTDTGTTDRPASTRHDDIIAAARAIAIEEGWAAVSVRRIAARAGCSAAAIYQYLPDKQAILQAIAADGEAALAAAMAAATADAGGPVKRMRAASAAYFEFVLENPALYRGMRGLDGVPAPRRNEPSPARRLLGDLAVGLVRKHDLREPPEELAAAIAAVLAGLAEAALHDDFAGPDRARAALARTVDDLMRGLGHR